MPRLLAEIIQLAQVRSYRGQQLNCNVAQISVADYDNADKES